MVARAKDDPVEHVPFGCRLLDLERRTGDAGTLTVVVGEGGGGLEPRRMILFSDVPPGAVRGGHAHLRAHQVVVVASGEVDATVGDGSQEAIVRLSGPGAALAVPPLVLLSLSGFSPGASVILLGSEPYDPDEVVGPERLRELRQASA